MSKLASLARQSVGTLIVVGAILLVGFLLLSRADQPRWLTGVLVTLSIASAASLYDMLAPGDASARR